jgi:O-Antigen ligase
MLYLLLGYVYLCIHRPFEIWPALGDLRIELIYFSGMTVCWLAAGKRVRVYTLLLATLGMGTAFVLSWVMSRWTERAEPVVKNYALVLVFALMIATSVRDTRGLNALVLAFMAVLALYMLHSVWEYKNGRHTFRMGIPRLVGVDTTLGDPNSFGATIVYSLPFTRYLWLTWGTGWRRGAVACYFLLALGCVLLTGSRSSLAGVVLWGMLNLLLSQRKVLYLSAFAVLACVGFAFLPPDLQKRFETIIDPSVGPANAQESGQGRVEGFYTGIKLWGQYPVAGCGPNAWRPASGSKIESHNLYGQVVGELGTVGLAAFAFMVAMLVWNLRKLKRLTHPRTGPVHEPRLFHLAQAMLHSTILLLFEGMFGHNLYRYNWVWYCAFVAVALGVCRDRQADPGPDFTDDDEDETEDEVEEWESPTCLAAG